MNQPHTNPKRKARLLSETLACASGWYAASSGEPACVDREATNPYYSARSGGSRIPRQPGALAPGPEKRRRMPCRKWFVRGLVFSSFGGMALVALLYQAWT